MWKTIVFPWCILMYGVHDRKMSRNVEPAIRAAGPEGSVAGAAMLERSRETTLTCSGLSSPSDSPTGGGAPPIIVSPIGGGSGAIDGRGSLGVSPSHILRTAARRSGAS